MSKPKDTLLDFYTCPLLYNNMVKYLPLVTESQSVTGSIDVNHNRFVPVDFLS